MLKRTSVIVKKLMDENDMLRNECHRLVEESMDGLKQRLEDTKELFAAAVETNSRDLQQHIKKVEISEPDPCLPSSFALVYFGRSRMWIF